LPFLHLFFLFRPPAKKKKLSDTYSVKPNPKDKANPDGLPSGFGETYKINSDYNPICANMQICTYDDYLLTSDLHYSVI